MHYRRDHALHQWLRLVWRDRRRATTGNSGREDLADGLLDRPAAEVCRGDAITAKRRTD
jgi:hypothetical protein